MPIFGKIETRKVNLGVHEVKWQKCFSITCFMPETWFAESVLADCF
jgi:hypothetical protein